MMFYEMETLIENLWRKNKESWEQTRTLGYITAQSQSTKKLDMQSLMTFPWEKGKMEDETPTQEERDEVYNEMKAMEKIMNKK